GQDSELQVVPTEGLAAEAQNTRHRDERQERTGPGHRRFEIQPLRLENPLHVGVEIEGSRVAGRGDADRVETPGLTGRVEVAGAIAEVQLDRPHTLDPADLSGDRKYAAYARVPAVLAVVRWIWLTGHATGGAGRLRPVLVRGGD